MKRGKITSILALGMSAVMMLSLAGCGSGAEEAANAPQTETAAKPAEDGEGEAPAAEAGSISYPLSPPKLFFMVIIKILFFRKEEILI